MHAGILLRTAQKREESDSVGFLLPCYLIPLQGRCIFSLMFISKNLETLHFSPSLACHFSCHWAEGNNRTMLLLACFSSLPWSIFPQKIGPGMHGIFSALRCCALFCALRHSVEFAAVNSVPPSMTSLALCHLLLMFSLALFFSFL